MRRHPAQRQRTASGGWRSDGSAIMALSDELMHLEARHFVKRHCHAVLDEAPLTLSHMLRVSLVVLD